MDSNKSLHIKLILGACRNDDYQDFKSYLDQIIILDHKTIDIKRNYTINK